MKHRLMRWSYYERLTDFLLIRSVCAVGSVGVLSWTDRVTVSVLLVVLKRLTVSADLSCTWCSDKMLQLIASRAVASFLLVAFADLQVLLLLGLRK